MNLMLGDIPHMLGLIWSWISPAEYDETMFRFGSSEHHTIGEDKLMKQRSKLLLDEAASWSLLWYLYGKGNDELPNDLIMFPTTSHLEACQFVNGNLTAQLCLRIVQWLEGLASKALDFENKVRGSHVGTYLPNSGVWQQTQRFIKKGSLNAKTISHLDFDAPTREHAQPLPDDKKQDESLLEDVWTFLRAGRLEEACNLCRSAGQPWRAATLSPFGRLDQKPSIEAFIKKGKTRALQAIELETGIGHQRRLWKWACYCASERIAEQDGGKYEIAVYAAQCSNLKRILPMCTNWEDIRRNESLLYLWYAEVELANCSQDGSESLLRALHILSCLGSGMKYTPYKCHRPSLMQLKARQGFRERLKMLHSSWSRGVIDDQSVSLVCCAALFEEISTGWTANAEIFDEAFSRVLPERRRNSHHLEFLFNYYLNMLSKHLSEVKLSKVWDSIVDGLQIYPFSPKLYAALVEIGHLYSSPNKLRVVFHEYFNKKPSVINWLFTLTFEMSRGGSQHRIRRFFERVLTNEKLCNSVIIWRNYIAYELDITCDTSAAKRVFFRAVHACPWSKRLWLDGFLKLNTFLSAKELSDLQEVMRDKELNLRTDIYEILLQDEVEC